MDEITIKPNDHQACKLEHRPLDGNCYKDVRVVLECARFYIDCRLLAVRRQTLICWAFSRPIDCMRAKIYLLELGTLSAAQLVYY
jgi:hypothetical protein